MTADTVRLRQAFESWALHASPDERTNWEVFQAGARAAAQCAAEGAGRDVLLRQIDDLSQRVRHQRREIAILRGHASKAQPKHTASEFTNELGNAIRITIEGPTSTSENVLTPMEADKLRSALNEHAAQAPAPGADVEGGDLPCPRCNGSGFELQWSDASPDAHQVEVNCDHCDGAGSLGAAYTHLSQLLKSERERSKKHTDELHWLKSGPFFGLRADKSVQTVADRLDELADACGKYDPCSERASDIRAAATIWRKHLAGPVPCAAVAHDEERFSTPEIAEAAQYAEVSDAHFRSMLIALGETHRARKAQATAEKPAWRIAQDERLIAGVRLKRYADGSFTAETEDLWMSVDPRDDAEDNYAGELVSVLDALWLAAAPESDVPVQGTGESQP